MSKLEYAEEPYITEIKRIVTEINDGRLKNFDLEVPTVDCYIEVEKKIKDKVVIEKVPNYELLEKLRETKTSLFRIPDELQKLKEQADKTFPEFFDPDPLEESMIPVQKASIIEQSNQFHTGIIEDMVELLEDVKGNIKIIISPPFTISDREKYAREDFEKEFYEKRVYDYADSIVDHIEGLIARDGYEQTMFGNYKALQRAIHESKDNRKLLLTLQKLVITARSAVPLQVLQREVEVIEPSILSQRNTS